MLPLEITKLRADNQRLTKTNLASPDEVVQWLGAVQAQDYAGAKWAIAQRMNATTDAMLAQAFADGSIIRTHLLRPTWHFVSPQDIRWLLKLTAPRVLQALKYMDRQVELDAVILKKSNAILIRELKGGKLLTRSELEVIFHKNKIQTTNLRMTHFMMHAELDAVVCSGGRRGKQFTYALLDERVPSTKSLTRAEALTELTRRYFTSRGPATLQDFVWWSGLTAAEARKGIESVKSDLHQETINSQTYWFSEPQPLPKKKAATAYLLPNYDEYIVGYTDRSAIYDGSHHTKLDARGNVLFLNTIVLNGQVRGTWKRTLRKNEVVIELTLFTKTTKAEAHAITEAAEGYGKFLQLPVSIQYKRANQ